MFPSNLPKTLASVCLSATVFFGTLTSCKKNDVYTEDTTSTTHMADLMAVVSKTTGVVPSKIVFDKEYQEFVIDKDLSVTLEDAEKRYTASLTKTPSANGTSQMRYTYVVSAAKAADVKVYADASVSADWVAILDQAIANWNGLNSGIHLTRVTSGTGSTTGGTTTGAVSSAVVTKRKKPTTSSGGTGTTSGGTGTTSGSGGTSTSTYDIAVNAYYDNATSTVAYAYMPDYSNNAGVSVSINTYYTYLSTAQKVFALTHELGHNLGFTHTDGTYGSLIPGTPQTDANSVMNSFVLSWAGFTYYDQVAALTVYPK